MINRKVVLYIAMSLDGFIAKNDGNLDFLSAVEKEGEDYGYAAFNETIDCVIVGRKTYDKVLSMGYDFHHADKESYIITRTARPSIGTVHFYTDNLYDLVARLKSTEGKNIFVDGGAEIVNELMKENLIDEFVISIIPVFLGNGISLFKEGRPEVALKLIDTKSFDKGLVQLHYVKI
ncbi:dihydrofolate reductase family protein [Flavobacterium sp. '19STA2R22 D10 B1']|uniref:dihydrofolate reductase family protein n=1 Tax=Flavobacterium aerium TaxID=3037261 RepID=UPI00278C3857|nr:dihydrofolate reductase family protein [Flavobacterium sp. '19STA2R22 D10 B1']